MRKPSSQPPSKRSNTSLSCNTSYQRLETSISTHKMDRAKRKRHAQIQHKIKKIFQKLKNQSLKSFDVSQNQTVVSLETREQNDTVICLDTTEQEDSVIHLDTELKNDTLTEIPVPTGQKRKISSLTIEISKKVKHDNSVILITDNAAPDINLNNIPYPIGSPKRSNQNINCSTPINKKDSNTLQNLIINNFSNLNNNISSNKVNEDIVNLTKEIHRDSYLTIDLTADSEMNEENNNIVDVDKTAEVSIHNDSSLVTLSEGSLSMSGDSQVTVLQNKENKRDNQLKKFAKCVSKLNSKDKGKLLEIIAENIFSCCDIKTDFLKTSNNKTLLKSQATETVQDTFIKEVILGEAKSRNSIGSNIYHPSKDVKNKTGLRMIVIDGSNVAMEHTRGQIFSVEGLKICIDYFLRRGHIVKAFVPRFRCKSGKSSNPRLLDFLERSGLVVYTPSREIQGRMCVSYDDRYIVQCAAEFDGIIVSGDNYRDLLPENPRWRTVIENRLLQFTWVDNMIMFPKDPLGRNGPTLDQFLRHPIQTAPPIIL